MQPTKQNIYKLNILGDFFNVEQFWTRVQLDKVWMKHMYLNSIEVYKYAPWTTRLTPNSYDNNISDKNEAALTKYFNFWWDL